MGSRRASPPAVGLGIGTSRVMCIIGESVENHTLNIIGIGEAESRGLRKGVIVNPDLAIDTIKRAVEDAERMSGVEAEEVTLNLSGSHLMGVNGQAVVAISGRDREIAPDDVRRAVDSACAIQFPAGHEIVDRLPQEFIVDDQDGINDPVGMIGARLAVKVHIITSPVTAKQNAINAVNRAGLRVTQMVLEQVAAAEATLSEQEKEFGVALVDIGAETTGLVVYERGAVQHTSIFPFGGAHFTNDIAIGLRTPIPEAETLKRLKGSASLAGLNEMERGETVEVPSVGGRPPRQVPRRILYEILQPRAEEVLMEVAHEIRNAGWERPLSGGVVLTGGGSLLCGMVDTAEAVFDAPARLGRLQPAFFGGLAEDVQSPAWASAAGLCLLAGQAQNAEARTAHDRRNGSGGLSGFMSKFRNRFGGIF